jgi:uncharacterized membrane protein
VSLYEGLLFVHVLGAVAWVGAVILGAFLYETAVRADDRGWLLRWLEHDERVTPVLYLPAVGFVLLAGIGLVLEGPWSFGDGWVVAGLLLLFAAAAVGGLAFSPVMRKLRAAVETSGLDSAEVGERIRGLRPLVWLDVSLLVAAVFVMTVKPF